MATPMRTISVKLPQRLDDALSDLALRRAASRSALVREALEALEALATSPHRSVTAAVDDHIATVDGPADLSTNPEQMIGYGT